MADKDDEEIDEADKESINFVMDLFPKDLNTGTKEGGKGAQSLEGMDLGFFTSMEAGVKEWAKKNKVEPNDGPLEDSIAALKSQLNVLDDLEVGKEVSSVYKRVILFHIANMEKAIKEGKTEYNPNDFEFKDTLAKPDFD